MLEEAEAMVGDGAAMFAWDVCGMDARHAEDRYREALVSCVVTGYWVSPNAK